MARVQDDIVHYFKTKGIDILTVSQSELYDLLLEHRAGLTNLMYRRELPLLDLIREVICDEQFRNDPPYQ